MWVCYLVVYGSKVAGSILTVRLSRKKKKMGFSCGQEPVKLNNLLKTRTRAIYIIASHSNTEKVALDTGYLIGVPDKIWEIRRI